MLLEWNDSLKIGIPEVDNQHRELFRRINNLYESCRNGKSKEDLLRIIRFLDDYIIGHFLTEEGYMTTYKYPELPSHKRQHQEFIEEFSDLKKWFNSHSDEPLVAWGSANKLLRDWWINHITKVDIKLGVFLKSRV